MVPNHQPGRWTTGFGGIPYAGFMSGGFNLQSTSKEKPISPNHKRQLSPPLMLTVLGVSKMGYPKIKWIYNHHIPHWNCHFWGTAILRQTWPCSMQFAKTTEAGDFAQVFLGKVLTVYSLNPKKPTIDTRNTRKLLSMWCTLKSQTNVFCLRCKRPHTHTH